jgi:DNA primase
MKFRIPESIIKSFLIEQFGDIKETSSGEIRINSPFTDDRKFHLYVNPRKGVVHDFKTNYGNDFVSFVGDYLQMNKSKVIPFLIREYSSKSISQDFSVSEFLEKSRDLVIPNGLFWFLEQKHGVIRDQAYKYLKKRRISDKVINELGYIFEPGSEYNKMIFIPFYEDGELVYFLCRDFTEKNILRYNNPKGLNSKNYVYNIDRIEDTVFIFEGVFDAMSLEDQVGTAMLSSDLGKEQAIKIINKIPRTIIFVPDNDEIGKKTLEKNIKLMLKYKPPSINFDILVYKIEEVKDFSETGKNFIEIEKCFKWKKTNILFNIF